MILSDRDLWTAQDLYGIVTPWNPGHLQPVSVDLTLGNEFIVNGARFGMTEAYALAPREFVLATTVEMIYMPPQYKGQIHGRSTWARRGLIVENAGLVDPGFRGTITLEVHNIGSDTLYLPLGERICQMTVEQLSSPAERPYGSAGLGSHYQGQSGVTAAHK